MIILKKLILVKIFWFCCLPVMSAEEHLARGTLYLVEIHSLVGEMLHPYEQDSLLLTKQHGRGSIVARGTDGRSANESDLLLLSECGISDFNNLEKNKYIKVLGRANIAVDLFNFDTVNNLSIGIEGSEERIAYSLMVRENGGKKKIDINALTKEDHSIDLEIWHGVRWSSSWSFSSSSFGINKILVFRVDDWDGEDMAGWWSDLKYGTLLLQRVLASKDAPAVPTNLLPPNAEQAGAGQPATSPESDSEGSDKPQPESEGRSR